MLQQDQTQYQAQYQAVVEQQKDQVYSFAYYYLGNREEAEDVTQEVLLRLWQCWTELEIDSMPRWMNRVTRNACFDLLRRRRVRRIVLADGGETAAQAPDPAPDPSEEAARSDFQNRLRCLLAELPEPYRSVLVLREIRELKYQEIAGALEVPINTVKTHVHRGRLLLRERLKEVFGHETCQRACVR